MRVCHCALPALSGNTDCCENCHNNIKSASSFKIQKYEPFVYPTKKEIVEKYDEMGKLIERITRDI